MKEDDDEDYLLIEPNNELHQIHFAASYKPPVAATMSK